MHPRLRLTLITLSLLSLLTAALAIALASRSSENGHSAAIVHDKSPFKGAERPKAQTEDFTLTDQDGHTVSLKEFRGRVVVLTFMYATCEDTCPVQAQLIVGALDDLDDLGKRIPALAVSVDPDGDTPTRARSFLLKHHARGRIRYLLGSESVLKPIWKEYGIQPQGKDFEHSASIVLLDKQGRQRVGHPASSTTPESLAHDIRLLAK